MAPGDKTHLLAIFVGPECRECRRKAGDIAKLASHTRGKPSVARVDCHFNRPMCHAFGVKEVPSVILIEKQKVYKFEEGLDFDKLSTFLDLKPYLADSSYLLNSSLDAFVR